MLVGVREFGSPKARAVPNSAIAASSDLLPGRRHTVPAAHVPVAIRCLAFADFSSDTEIQIAHVRRHISRRDRDVAGQPAHTAAAYPGLAVIAIFSLRS